MRDTGIATHCNAKNADKGAYMLAHTSPLKESMYESDIKRTHEQGHAVAREPRCRRAPPEISLIHALFCKGVSPQMSTPLDHPDFFPLCTMYPLVKRTEALSLEINHCTD